MKARVFLEGKPEPFIQVYESDAKGNPLKRNNKYNTTETNELGEYVLNVPVSPNYYLTVQTIGIKKTYKTINVPTIINLTSNSNLPEIEVKAKRTYWWLLLLLIPFILKKKRKK